MEQSVLKDHNWFAKHNLARYRGKYVAVADQKVQASGYNAKNVYTEAKKKAPQSRPILAKIPEEDVMGTSAEIAQW